MGKLTKGINERVIKKKIDMSIAQNLQQQTELISCKQKQRDQLMKIEMNQRVTRELDTQVHKEAQIQ
jgi:hypothetical protein